MDKSRADVGRVQRRKAALPRRPSLRLSTRLAATRALAALRSKWPPVLPPAATVSCHHAVSRYPISLSAGGPSRASVHHGTFAACYTPWRGLRALLDRASPLSSLHHFHGSSAFRRPASDPFDRCRWNSRRKALFLTCDLM
jgi:hypothetical protein